MSTKVISKADVEITADVRVSLEIELKNDIDGMSRSLTLNSTVEEVLDDGSLLIHMPIHQGYHYPLPRDTKLQLCFFVDLQIYATDVEYVERLEKDGFIFAKLRRRGKITKYQRRDCYRLPYSIPVQLERYWRNGNDEEINPELQPTEGQMIDFSDGGMLFATNENIDVGEKITLTFDMGKAETAKGMALRTERIEDGKYLFRVAVRFRNNDKAQKDRFYKYIMEKQMEERRRWMQNLQSIYVPGNNGREEE